MDRELRAVVIHCIDYRFIQSTINFCHTLGLEGRFEDVGIAGSAKNIVDPYDPTDIEFVMRQISLSRKLHAISEVVLINHLQCGAYGIGTFANLQEEHDRHVRDLTTAKLMIEHRFEGLAVMAFLGRIDDRGSIDFEKII